MRGKILFLCLIGVLGFSSCEKNNDIKTNDIFVGNFGSGQLDGWEAQEFHGITQYRIVVKHGRKVLEGDSKGTASGLIKQIEVDLQRFPFLHWSWRTTRLLENNDERSKKGDDFPVRIFVLISGSVLFADPLALNYVWSRNQPVGASWPNPFVPNATMLAVESGGGKLNRWVSYKRNIREDLKQYLETDADTTLAVALMVDTDNTGQNALSYFGDIYFSEN